MGDHKMPPGSRFVGGKWIVPFQGPKPPKRGVKIPGTTIGRPADVGPTTGDAAMDETLGIKPKR